MDLSDLVSRLTADVPARNSVPSSGQYEQCVKDGVHDFNRRASTIKITTINVVGGQADYTLPDDFVKWVDLAMPLASAGVLVTGAGLVPVPPNWSEQQTIVGLTLTLVPTPTYSGARQLRYGAGHVLDESETYPVMSEEIATIVLLKASSKALTLQATAAAREAWQYTIGEERVSKEKLAAEFRAQAESYERQYEDAIRVHRGHIVTAG